MGAVYNGLYKTSRKDDLDYLLMCKEYENYIITHKENVMKAYQYLFVENDYSDRLPEEISMEEWDDALYDLKEEVEHHDDSKYTDEEFEPYRRHFNKTQMEKLQDEADPESAKLAEEEYERAWIHHYLINSHHPEFWNHTELINGQIVPHIEPNKDGPRDMDLLNILHMICDWSGMSLKFRNKYSPVSWYNTMAANKRKAMSQNTKHKLFLILSMMFPEEEVIE